MTAEQDVKNGHWFADLVMKFTPVPDDVAATGTPEEMIREDARKAFWVSTALSAPWGPVGLATVLPEIVAIMKIQLGLIHKIANYFERQEALRPEVILFLFAHALGLTFGPQIFRTAGTAVAIKSLGRPLVGRIARKIGMEVALKISRRAVGRWVPVLLAPLFGWFSLRMTERIGRRAVCLFSREITVEEPVSRGGVAGKEALP